MPKRTKAIKKGDIKQQKPWLKREKPSIYAIETRDTYKTILIVCEGQTEELYFKSFPVHTRIKVVELGGQSKLKLIESTLSIIENENKTYDEVWCVFDMDYRQGGKEFADFDNAIKKGRELDYNIAYSNDAFELWFYLHYEYNDQKNHRTFYYQQLGKKWEVNYEKAGKTYSFCRQNYSRLENDINASQEKAIERAKKLYENQQDLPFHQQNPVTLVYKLVLLLNENKRN